MHRALVGIAKGSAIMLSPKFVLLVGLGPVVALFLLSLGLIALKQVPGLSRQAMRLVAPPFYFVSLPIATLIVGLETPIWALYLASDLIFGVPDLFYADISRFYDLWFVARFYPLGSLVAISYLLALAVSGHALWRTLFSHK